jgi:hypothetical protein
MSHTADQSYPINTRLQGLLNAVRADVCVKGIITEHFYCIAFYVVLYLTRRNLRASSEPQALGVSLLPRW